MVRVRSSHFSLTAALVVLFMLAAASVATAAPSQRGERVPVIVVFEDVVQDPDAAAREMTRRNDGELRFVYEHALKGFAAGIPSGRVDNIERDPRVAYVELDRTVRIQAVTVPTGIDRVEAEANTAIGIDGVDDQRVDVDVAVLDTGIDLDHPDLDVVAGVSCLSRSGGSPWTRTYSCDPGGDDGHGHGTHVAGTIAALDDGPNFEGVDVVGVAPGARLHAVKVLDDNGSGTTGSVIAGIDYVTANAGVIEVANMSLGGSGESQAMDDALKASYEAGVAYAVAAGNSSADVDAYHPAGSPWVLTVSALADFDGRTGGTGSPTCRTDVDDTFANFSNYGDTAGQDVDVIAPGVCILSTATGGGYVGGWSGTSMASPHVAGAAALLASGGATAAEIVGVVDSNGIDGDGVIETNGGVDWDETDDPDTIKEPLLHVGDSAVFAPVLVAGSVASSTDISVTGVSAPSTVVEGDLVSVDVTVANVGTNDVVDDITVTLTDDTSGQPIGTQTISGLVAGASATLTYSWDTTGVTLGDHTLTGAHGFADDVQTNDSSSTVTTVETVSTDIAVTGVSAPTSVVEGEPASVDVTVANAGNQDVGSDITVTLTDDTGSQPIGSQTISGLVAGASVTLTYSWDTTGVTLGDHTLTGAHGFADDDAGNDASSTVVQVVEQTTDMHVGDLDSASINNGPTWTPQVIVAVHDDSDNPVVGATVTGSWSGDASGAGTCTTGTDGRCTIQDDEQFPKKLSSVNFAVGEVTHGDLTYNADHNHDPDGDSDGTSIVVTKS